MCAIILEVSPLDRRQGLNQVATTREASDQCVQGMYDESAPDFLTSWTSQDPTCAGLHAGEKSQLRNVGVVERPQTGRPRACVRQLEHQRDNLLLFPTGL